jgi:hypothetical protein
MHKQPIQAVLVGLLLVAAGGLAGCSQRPAWLPEEVARGARADWQQLVGHPIHWPGVAPLMAKPSEGCTLWFAQNRVLTQDGINDAVSYRRCPNVADGYYHVGQRLDGRPRLGETGPLPPSRPASVTPN